MIYIILIGIGLAIVFAIKTSPISNLSNWHHNFVNFQFSSQEFYKKVEEAIVEHELPDVTFSRVTHSQGGIFSSKREYLRVRRNEYIFDICAAPFGRDFFVSWWMGESVRDILARIPIFNTLLGKNSKNKTYYQMDTEAMFRGSIHKAMMEAIDQITSSNGLRVLSDIERLPKDLM